MKFRTLVTQILQYLNIMSVSVMQNGLCVVTLRFWWCATWDEIIWLILGLHWHIAVNTDIGLLQDQQQHRFELKRQLLYQVRVLSRHPSKTTMEIAAVLLSCSPSEHQQMLQNNHFLQAMMTEAVAVLHAQQVCISYIVRSVYRDFPSVALYVYY